MSAIEDIYKKETGRDAKYCGFNDNNEWDFHYVYWLEEIALRVKEAQPQADSPQSDAIALCKRAVMYSRGFGDIPRGHPIIDEMAEVAAQQHPRSPSAGEIALCVEKLKAIRLCVDCSPCDCCSQTIDAVVEQLRTIAAQRKV